MTVEAAFELAGEELLFGKISANFSSLSLDIEQVVPAGEQVMPYVWVTGQEPSLFARAARETDGVKSVQLLDQFHDRALYRIEWGRDTEQFVSGILDTGGTVIEASGDTEWLFRIRFESRSELAAFREHCRDHEIDCQLQQVQTSTPEISEREFGLTDAQYEAITVAIENGYFEVPRNVTFDELASELDITQQAVSDRIQRGINKIVNGTVEDSI